MSAIVPLLPTQVQNDPRNWSVSGEGLMQEFGTKYASEKQLLEFLFAPDLALTGAKLALGVPPKITVTCVRGNDQEPNALLAGTSTVNIATSVVTVPVQGGLPDARYIIEVNMTTTVPGLSPTVAGVLPIGYP